MPTNESWRTKEPEPIFSPPPSSSRLPDDGEEAYLRRVAMSRPEVQELSKGAAPTSSFLSTGSSPAAAPPVIPQIAEEAYFHRLPMSPGIVTPPPPLPAPEDDDDVPYLSPPPQAALLPASQLPDPQAVEAQIKAKREAAAAIAARLAQLGQQPESVTPNSEGATPPEP